MESGTLLLHHTAEDAEKGRRAHFTDILDGFPCHEDVQLTVGEVLLLQYVSKHVSKFSDSNCDEWLNDEASTDSVAWRVLKEYHPLEPEMILQLAGAAFRQWQYGTSHGGKRNIVALKGDATPEVEAFMKSKWRQDKMSFLEFLRKSTAKVMQSWFRS